MSIASAIESLTESRNTIRNKMVAANMATETDTLSTLAENLTVVDGGDYVQKSGDTMTGQLTVAPESTTARASVSVQNKPIRVVGTGIIASMGTGSDANPYLIIGPTQGDDVHGNASGSIGQGCNASGVGSFAHGVGSISSGSGSFASGGGSQATADYTHAEGAGSQAKSEGAHAEGGGTIASGKYSHTEGSGTTASGENSHAGGIHSTANGRCSFAHGVYAETDSTLEGQFAIGKYNTTSSSSKVTDPIFIVGNGTGTSNHSNAFMVGLDGRAHVQKSISDEYGNLRSQYKEVLSDISLNSEDVDRVAIYAGGKGHNSTWVDGHIYRVKNKYESGKATFYFDPDDPIDPSHIKYEREIGYGHSGHWVIADGFIKANSIIEGPYVDDPSIEYESITVTESGGVGEIDIDFGTSDYDGHNVIVYLKI